MKSGIKVIGTGLENAVNHSEIEPQTEFALIMGNEGSGVDPELLAAADATVKIPMYGKAESLNVAVATGILLYTLFEKITSNLLMNKMISGILAMYSKNEKQ